MSTSTPNPSHSSPHSERNRVSAVGASHSEPVASSLGANDPLVEELLQYGCDDILQQLHFSAVDGQIWLEARRMLLLDAAAFGSLRSEIVALLGVEKARGVLTRMGYLIGSRDAEMALMSHSRSSPNGPLAVGPFLHALRGFVKPEPVRLNIDIATGACDCEFLWHHSVEHAPAGIDAGIAGDATCWLAVGQATGFLTRLLGRQVIVREVECEATGGTCCRAIAKPAEDWDDAEEDLRYLTLSRDILPPRPSLVSADPNDPAVGRAPASLRSNAEAHPPVTGIVAASAAMTAVLHKVRRVAPTNASVLLLGESGVGKSRIAREVHECSRRADKPLVEVNCAAIPDQLVESELFGVERGAFSGASESRAGRFEAADGGSLFLDEIATLSLTAQGKLLRVLQTGELERLGSNRTIKVNVRMLAATNVDLNHEVRTGRFREDLFYRLNVFPVHIPPLRERREDLPPLLEWCISRFGAYHGRLISGVTPRALQAILHYDWPGNIREFENVIERGLILAEDHETLDLRHLFSVEFGLDSKRILGLAATGKLVAYQDAVSLASRNEDAASRSTLHEWAVDAVRGGNADLGEIQAALIEAALTVAKGNVSKAAPLLGLTRAQLDYRLKKPEPSDRQGASSV